VENCAPEEFRFKLRPAGGEETLPPEEQAKLRPLSDSEKNSVRILRDDVIKLIENFHDDKSCAEAIYAAAAKAEVDGKVLFAAAYQALIGKDQGPRLASFLRVIDKERLLSILGHL
jgi:lysyl-tRNA synthetase class 1